MKVIRYRSRRRRSPLGRLEALALNLRAAWWLSRLLWRAYIRV